MSLYESLVRPLAFRMDPERVHEMAMGMLQKGAFRARSFRDKRLEQSFFGVDFANPLGLAAGFDKNAVALEHWHQLGFGFVECGTVTAQAQPGNPKPRMFRIPEEKALINRLGFNNDGARTVAGRLAAARAHLPVGVNLGKSKVTPLEEAAADYQTSFRLLHPFGQYFVVNVSSPNTPGLRTLQEKGPLREIFAAMREVDAEKPLFVKVAPDLELSALDDVLEVAIEARLTGMIATNTTIRRDMLGRDPNEGGGLSGAPLKAKADATLAHLARKAPKEMILIGVGGIMTGDDVYDKIRLGAHLCQVYTGWIYSGPHMVPNCLERMVQLMDRDGVKSLDEVRGKDL
ncbi:MAG: quinone-dependent dihydroorotate dehydrogenase [Fimbriimonas sp.]